MLAAAVAQPNAEPPARDAILRAGEVSEADYPADLAQGNVGGTTIVRYRVAAHGRVDTCNVTESSGSPVLDRTVCMVIQRRFRYQPAADAAGRPTNQWFVTSWTWTPPASITVSGPMPERGN